MAAVVELPLELLRGQLAIRAVGAALLQGLAKGFQCHGQFVKGAGVFDPTGHAGANFGRVTGGIDLPYAIGQGIHQAQLQVWWGLCRCMGQDETGQTVQRVLIHGLEPLNVKGFGLQEEKQRTEVACVGGGGQKLHAQAVAQVTHERRA